MAPTRIGTALRHAFAHAAVLRHHWQREQVTAARARFFEEVHASCAQEAGEIDVMMGQDDVIRGVVALRPSIDARMGTLMMSVETDFFGQRHEYSYSLFQLGNQLKIGVLLSGGLEQAPLVDSHMELTSLWPGVEATAHSRAGAVLYDWSFEVAGLYEHWLAQERFVLGMRHFHVRFLRVVRDFAQLRAEPG